MYTCAGASVSMLDLTSYTSSWRVPRDISICNRTSFRKFGKYPSISGKYMRVVHTLYIYKYNLISTWALFCSLLEERMRVTCCCCWWWCCTTVRKYVWKFSHQMMFVCFLHACACVRVFHSLILSLSLSPFLCFCLCVCLLCCVRRRNHVVR